MLKVIVTGTGRCGTAFLAKLITSMGLPCGHESIFDYSEESKIKERLVKKEKRTISQISCLWGNEVEEMWINPLEIEGESSYMAAPFLDWEELENTKIIHLFRDPLKVVRSFLLDFSYFKKNKPDPTNPFNKFGFEQKIWETLPKLGTIKNDIERACYFYYEWNKLIEQKSKNKKVIKIKIEDPKKNEKIAKFLNLDIKNRILFDNEKQSSFDSGKIIKVKDIPEGEIKNNFLIYKNLL